MPGQPAPAKGWCFTLNNYTDDEQSTLRQVFSDTDVFSYAIFGRELSDSGTPHLQGYLACTKKQRLQPLKVLLKIDRVHLEKRKGSHQQALDYCKKEADFEEFGNVGTSQGSRTRYREDPEVYR